MEKKLQVFVSSTYNDLVIERQKAVEGILRAKHIPAGMELFIPNNKSQWEIIEEWIRDSDVLLLLLGGRYGTVEKNSGISYTELEYEYAQKNNIPVFALVLDDQFLANKKSQDITLKVFEHEVEFPMLQHYKNFKEKVTSNLVSFVSDVNQIPTEITLALQQFCFKDQTEYSFKGWVRGKSKSINEVKTLEYFVQMFLVDKERQGIKQKTLESYKLDLDIFATYFDGIKIDEVSTNCIKSFFAFRKDEYSITSSNTLEKIRSILNNFFEWLVAENVLSANPVKKISAFKFIKKTNTSLNLSELDSLRAACKTSRERALVETFVSTGCRLEEFRNLRLSDVNWSNNTILIKGYEQERLGTLSLTAIDKLKEYFNERRDDSEFLFVTERKPFRQISNRGIQDGLGKIVERSSITRRVTPRTLRETFSKLMLDNGYCQWNILQELLGYHPKAKRSETFFAITNETIWKLVHSPLDI